MCQRGLASISRHRTFPGTSRSRPLALKRNYWLGSVGIKEETAAENLKFSSKSTILEWTLDSWAELPTEVIKKNSLKLRVEPTRGRHDSLPQGTTALWQWTIIASIAVASFERARHKSLWMYRFWFWESISVIISFGFGSWRGQRN